MATNSYNDISTANSVKLLNTFSVYNEYIMLYTEIDSHIEIGDRVYITIVGDIGDISQNSIILDNLYSSNIESLYNDVLQGYTVVYIDKTKNAVVINKKIKDISVSDDISGFTIENQYISKVTIHNITMDKGSINGATIKYGKLNNTHVDDDTINWIQGNIFGGEIFKLTLDNKYDNSYITLRKLESMDYIFTSNNTELGKCDGYSYFNNLIIQDCIITNGNFNSCDLQNTDNTNKHHINGGVFNNCNYVGYDINGGYHKNIIDLDRECTWNNGYFDCHVSGYSFNLKYWYNGTFMGGKFGGTEDQSVYNPIWVNGEFNNGVFDSYRWENGEFNNGIFGASGVLGNKSISTYTGYETHLGITKKSANGNLLDASSTDNIYEYTTFLNGIINGGFFVRTKIHYAIIGNGFIADSTILNVKNLGGMLVDCSIKKGELLGGYVRTNLLSVVLNDCIIADTDIGVLENDNSLLNYKSDSDTVKKYIEAYSGYTNNSTKIFINNCSLVSPICKMKVNNTNEYSYRIFINKQNFINGGIYENIYLTAPQAINGGSFKNVKLEYTNTNTNTIPNSAFCSVRPIRVLTDKKGNGSKVYTMFEFSNTEDSKKFVELNNTGVKLYGFFYTKLSNYGTGNNVIFDRIDVTVLDNKNFYDPKKFTEENGEIIFSGITTNTDTYVIINMHYVDYMFGDFGILYTHSLGKFDSLFEINGGTFENCNLMGLSDVKPITINGGTFDNSNFNGFTKINSCNFNGGIISGNSNEWNGGNFNSGIFSEDSSSNDYYELQLKKGSQAYILGPTSPIQQITGKMLLENIYPLIIRRGYTDNKNFDSIGNIYDEEYQEYYLDIWNETGIDFTAVTSKNVWSDNTINEDNYLLVPSHFVFVIAFSGDTEQRTTEYQKMLSFIQKHVNIDILDTNTTSGFNKLYNKLYKDLNGNEIPVNDFRNEYINYYSNPYAFKIALIFKFPKIEELYNNKFNKNPWFDNIFIDYNLYFKNVWADANAGYFVRPMPVYKETVDVSYSYLTISNNDYGNYPTISRGCNNNYSGKNLPAPWHFDNNGKLWLPLHQGDAKDYYDYYKAEIEKYSKAYFKNTDTIFPYEYFKFRKNNNNFSFNTYLPSTKTVKTDNISDSIEVNNNIASYVNMGMGNKNILSIDVNKCSIYGGGWEDYMDIPFNFETLSISDIDQSWIYLDQFYGITTNDLDNAMINPKKFIHVVSHDENYVVDYDGPCRLLSYSNVMNEPLLYRIKVDKKILNNYGRIFITDSNNFIFDDTFKIIKILNFGTNNYSVKAGCFLYIYTPTTRQNVTKVTIKSEGKLKVFGDREEMWVDIEENISIRSESDLNFVYGLDSWDIDTINTPDNYGMQVSRMDINTDINHYSGGFNGPVIPSNEKNNKWIYNDPIYIVSESLNTTKSSINKGKYPNSYVQGKIIKIKNIKENYDGIYLYDTVFNYSSETDRDAGKVNVYLYDKTDIPNYNKSWLKDTATVNVIGNSIDFDQNLTLLDGYPKLTGTVIRYKTMASFKKATNLFSISADTSDTNYEMNINNISNNKNYVEIHGLDKKGILSGVFDNKPNDKTIIIESIVKASYTNETIPSGCKTYALRTLPIHYTDSSIKKDRGNYVEFYKILDGTDLKQALVINTEESDIVITIKYDKRDTFYGEIINVSNYIGKEVAIYAKISTEYIYYSGTIKSVKVINQNICEVNIILNRDIDKLETVEFGYFYIIEEMTIGTCYRYYTSPEITENDDYHHNSGDPSKPIRNSPKHLLRRLNEIVRTTETSFERQAGITIRSRYNLNGGETKVSDIFNGGNFYSGDFYGEWNDGEWFASDSSFKGDNYYNIGLGLDFTKAPNRKLSTAKNFTDIINTLIKRGEYFMYPPWSNKERQNVITPKISRSDEY